MLQSLGVASRRGDLGEDYIRDWWVRVIRGRSVCGETSVYGNGVCLMKDILGGSDGGNEIEALNIRKILLKFTEC